MTVKLSKKIMKEIFSHAEQCDPHECCGLVVMINGKKVYRPCRNRFSGMEAENRFDILPADYIKAEDEGDILMVVHSHCYINGNPSDSDKVECEKSGLPWLVVQWPTRQVVQIKPCGFELPLIGRQFDYGISDCYSLAEDYYERELNIKLKHLDRPPNEWWKNGEDFFTKNFKRLRFKEIDAVEKHCVILMQMRSKFPNHMAIYLGDNMILHHCEGQLSRRDVYGGMWKKHTVKILKYKGPK